MAPRKCFCGSPKRNAEVQCSECKTYIHYECLGLSFKELCTLLNETPGIYICKTCAPKVNEVARKKFLAANKGCQLFEFDNETYGLMNSPDLVDVPTVSQLTQALESKFEKLEKRIVDSFVKQNKAISYATVASKRAPSANRLDTGSATQRDSRGSPRGPHIADPTRSILVARLDEPKQFSQNCIKEKLISIKSDIAPMISHARVINSGKLLIEARSVEFREQLLALPMAPFGQHACIYAMDAQRRPERPRGVITRGMHKDLNLADFQREVKYEYRSADDFSIIPGRENSSFCSVKFSVSDSEEFGRILNRGCFFDFLHLRVEPLVAGPRRCFNCQRFGHIAKVCRSQKRCSTCGSSDTNHAQPCQAAAKCCNCNGNHESRDKECPSFKAQIDIIRSAAYNV